MAIDYSSVYQRSGPSSVKTVWGGQYNGGSQNIDLEGTAGQYYRKLGSIGAGANNTLAKNTLKAYEEYAAEKEANDRFNSTIEQMGAEASRYSGLADSMLTKMIGTAKSMGKDADQAFELSTGLKADADQFLADQRAMYEPLIGETVDQVRKGILDEKLDVRGAQNRAEAEYANQFENARESTVRDAARYGINPTSGRFASADRGTRLAEAATRAGAREQAFLDERARIDNNKLVNANARIGLTQTGQGAIDSANQTATNTGLSQIEAKLAQGRSEEVKANIYGSAANIYANESAAAAKGLSDFALANQPEKKQGRMTYYGTGLYANT